MKRTVKSTTQGFRSRMTALIFACCLGMSCHAQAVEFPTIDLYDSGMMNMYTDAYARTFGQRKQNYLFYSEMALDAYKRMDYNKVFQYSQSAIETGLDNGVMYYMRGIAFHEIGRYSDALKEYKKAKSMGIKEAAVAYDNLKRELKQMKK